MLNNQIPVRAKGHVSMRRPLLLLLKAAISILLLYASLRAVDLTALGERLGRLDVVWIITAFLLLAAQVVLVAFRWRMIVMQCGSDLGPLAALRMSFIAMFFNSVLPSTVGGDAARVVMLKRAGSDWANATYSVVIDRVAGVTVLSLIVLACLPWSLRLVQDPVARAFLLLIGGGAVAGAFVFISIGALRTPLLNRWAVTRHFVEVSRVAWRVCRNGRSLAAVAATSLIIHLTTIAVTWCIAQSAAASASFTLLLFLIPPVLLIATVPVSIAGWGLRETSMIVAFASAGLARGDGLIVSVLYGLLSFAIGGIGGMIWIIGDLQMSALRSDAAQPD